MEYDKSYCNEKFPWVEQSYPEPIPDICHKYHKLDMWRKICHVEKFQIYMHDKCGEI